MDEASDVAPAPGVWDHDATPPAATIEGASPGGARSGEIATRSPSGSWRVIVPVLSGVAAIVGGFLIWSGIGFGSPGDGLLFLQGVRLVVEPTVVSVGEGRAGDHKGATFRVRNLSGRPVAILGSKASCTCVATDALPLTLAPGRSRELNVDMALEGGPGTRVEQSVVYITDARQVPRFGVVVTGQVAAQ